MRCRSCSARKKAYIRFPLKKRHPRICENCADRISHRSKLGRCRRCYLNERRERASQREWQVSANGLRGYYYYYDGKDSLASRATKNRSTNRDNNGTCYSDKNGILHYANDEIKPDLTVAAAWSCMRRCWRAYKLAINGRNNDGRDDEKRVEYAWRIVSLCKLLNIEAPYFSELDIEEEEEEDEEVEADEEYVLADNEDSSRRRTRSKGGANDGHEGVNEENYYYNNDESGDDQYASQENFTGW